MTLKPFASGFVGDPACLVTTISTGLVVAVDVASVGFAAASEVRVETVLPEALSVSVAGEIAVDVVFTVSAEAVVDVGGGGGSSREVVSEMILLVGTVGVNVDVEVKVEVIAVDVVDVLAVVISLQVRHVAGHMTL